MAYPHGNIFILRDFLKRVLGISAYETIKPLEFERLTANEKNFIAAMPVKQKKN